MVLASRNLFETPGGARVFLLRRIARIVPFYWVMTTIFLLTMLLAPKALSSGAPTVAEIVKSYLFIPYARDGAEMMQPVYKLGWTLNYEMFFYVMFASVIILPLRSAVTAIAVVFTALAVLGALFEPALAPIAFWMHPIILEFVMGAVIAMAFLEGVRLRRREAMALAAIAFAALMLSGMAGLEAHAVTRPMIWGLPAAAILACAALIDAGPCAAPGSAQARIASFAIALGDASYAIYLLHPIVVRGLRLVWDKAGATAIVPSALFVAIGLALVIPLAFAVHRWFERPVTAWAQRLLGVDRRGVTAPAPLARSA